MNACFSELKERPNAKQPRAGVLSRYLWKTGETIKIQFLPVGESQTREWKLGGRDLQDAMRKVAEEWMTYANVRFSFVRGPLAEVQAEVRIAFNPIGGSWSKIGTDCRSVTDLEKPTMNFGWDLSDPEELRRVTLHEFGHMLGLVHEHKLPSSRSRIQWNEAEVYKHYAALGWSPEDTKFNVLDRYNDDQTQYSKFDPNSIMLYAIPNSLTMDNRGLPWRNMHLSSIDKVFIATRYLFDPIPLFRLYNSTKLDHFYTIDAKERDDAIKLRGYKSEGSPVLVERNQTQDNVPFFRIYRDIPVGKENHFYTTKAAERDMAVKINKFKDEGNAGFVFSEAGIGRMALVAVKHADSP